MRINNPDDIGEAGWSVILPSDPRIKEALLPLLKLREEEACAKHGPLYREYSVTRDYLHGDSKSSFLARQGRGPGPIDPTRAPLYLLIVGSPREIPFSFQYQMGTRYRVGRVHFEDVESYYNYARSVTEADAVSLDRKITFFGVENLHDRPTELLAPRLIRPLVEALAGDNPGWLIDAVLAEHATKAKLRSILSAKPPSAITFIAAHGIRFWPSDHRYNSLQGAIVCSSWARGEGDPVRKDIFSATDLPNSADLRGAVIIFFGSHGAGSTRYRKSEFSDARPGISVRPSVAPLPKRLLGNKAGGALAFIGHVNTAYETSFDWNLEFPQVQSFEAVLHAILSGQRVGAAMEQLCQRHAEITAELQLISRMRRKAGSERKAFLRHASLDAAEYILIGDPAVRLSPSLVASQ
jgi:hypothetical protein